MSETRYRPIDIDFEVYQLIVIEKRGFDESDNAALRRLLGLDTSERVEAPLEPKPLQPPRSGSWSGKDIALPEGTRLRMTYGGIEHNGTVVGGKWEIEGQRYNTPSQAASAVARTKRGGKTRLNGWKLWHVKRPSDTGWVSLDRLRDGDRG